MFSNMNTILGLIVKHNCESVCDHWKRNWYSWLNVIPMHNFKRWPTLIRQNPCNGASSPFIGLGNNRILTDHAQKSCSQTLVWTKRLLGHIKCYYIIIPRNKDVCILRTFSHYYGDYYLICIVLYYIVSYRPKLTPISSLVPSHHRVLLHIIIINNLQVYSVN